MTTHSVQPQRAGEVRAPVQPPLVPGALLRSADKILFVAHLALGDFTYLQSCLRAFAEAFPHIRIHLFVDERRRMRASPAEWEHLKKYVLFDWLAECSYLDKVYTSTYSPATYKQSIAEARQQDYPIVVSLAVLQRHRYASLARQLSPRGFVVGQKLAVSPWYVMRHLRYRQLDAFIPAYSDQSRGDQHISDIYAGWFARMFGMDIAPAARFPVLDIPEQWITYARGQFAAWGFAGAARAADAVGAAAPVVFVNAFAKSAERCWPLERVIELIRAMRAEPAWRDTRFVVNVVPEEMARARALFDAQALPHTQLFSAEDNFFQLPAVLSLCDLIISVETAVMHLANAVHVPVIALMRTLTPEWAPIDKANSTVIEVVGEREDWVDKISVDQVMQVLRARPAPGAAGMAASA